MNGYLNTTIQKGFVGGMERVLEHTALLEHILRLAKRRQLSIYTVLFDLRNAFGEIRHIAFALALNIIICLISLLIYLIAYTTILKYLLHVTIC